jgi:hypothetical protein
MHTVPETTASGGHFVSGFAPCAFAGPPASTSIVAMTAACAAVIVNRGFMSSSWDGRSRCLHSCQALTDPTRSHFPLLAVEPPESSATPPVRSCGSAPTTGSVSYAFRLRANVSGVGGTLQDAAWLATRFDALPPISTAYDRSELSWAAARAVCKVALPADEGQWLDLVRRSTVDALPGRPHRRPDDVPPDPEGEPNEIDS